MTAGRGPLMGAKRGRRPTRRLDMSEVREAVADGRVWVGLGKVVNRDGGDHYQFDADVGVLVEVDLMPSETSLLCRLGGFGQGGAQGVWRIPPVGTEVVVGVVDGEVDASPCILAVLASGDVPDELDGDTLVVKAPRVVVIAADGPVEIGEQGLVTADGLVHGSGVDSFTGAQYWQLGNTSSTVRAKK